jgi:hypothetical protein
MDQKHKQQILYRYVNIINKIILPIEVFNFINFDTYANIYEMFNIAPDFQTYARLNSINIYYNDSALSTDKIRIYFSYEGKSPLDDKIRSPYFLTLGEIIYAGYYKIFIDLLKYVKKNRQVLTNLTKFPFIAQKMGFDCKSGYIIAEEKGEVHVVKSIEDSIFNCDVYSLNLLIDYYQMEVHEKHMELLDELIKDEKSGALQIKEFFNSRIQSTP